MFHHRSIMTSGLKRVHVYCGEGSSPNSVHMLNNTLNTFLKGTDYSVHLITPDEIKEGQWQSFTALLALGGGYDLGYIHALGKCGMDKICKYVQDGGSYLGICAGGYFGCTEIEFDKGGPQEVCGKGRLGFFPGKCVGPLFSTYVYNSEAGAHASLVHWCFLEPDERITSQNCYCYFNGGGKFIPYQPKHDTKYPTDESSDFFEGAQDTTHGVNRPNKDSSSKQSATKGKTEHSQYKVIAMYAELPSAPAAAVKCMYGKGVAFLSGVHFESDATQMDSKNLYLQGIIPKILESNKARVDFIISALKYLGLHIAH